MARPSRALVTALRVTAARIADGARYQWTHMGACNCGHLLQTVSDLGQADIHRMATQSPGDWGEQASEYCPTSGVPMTALIDRLLELGLTTGDIHDLERLNNRKVALQTAALLGVDNLDHRRRSHVVAYMRTWADALQDRLPPPELRPKDTEKAA